MGRWVLSAQWGLVEGFEQTDVGLAGTATLFPQENLLQGCTLGGARAGRQPGAADGLPGAHRGCHRGLRGALPACHAPCLQAAAPMREGALPPGGARGGPRVPMEQMGRLKLGRGRSLSRVTQGGGAGQGTEPGLLTLKYVSCRKWGRDSRQSLGSRGGGKSSDSHSCSIQPSPGVRPTCTCSLPCHSHPMGRAPIFFHFPEQEARPREIESRGAGIGMYLGRLAQSECVLNSALRKRKRVRARGSESARERASPPMPVGAL